MRCLLVLLTACSWLPPDKPEEPVATGDPAAFEWVVQNYVVGGNATLTDDVADRMRGRKVTIEAAAYTSPWQGSCDSATRESRKRKLTSVANEVDLSEDGGGKIKRFGLTSPVTEVKLSCKDSRRPPLTIYVSGPKALTCFSGVCYLLDR